MYADLIVVVSDASSPFYRQQRRVVGEVLAELGAQNKPVIEALNKCDLLPEGSVMEPADAILISASEGTGLDRLLEEIAKGISRLRHRCELTVPYAKGAVLSLIHAQGQVESEEYTEEGTRVVCSMDAVLHARVMKELKGE